MNPTMEKQQSGAEAEKPGQLNSPGVRLETPSSPTQQRYYALDHPSPTPTSVSATSPSDTDKIAVQHPHDPSQIQTPPVYDGVGTPDQHHQAMYGSPQQQYAGIEPDRVASHSNHQQYKNATPLRDLMRTPAPVDCPSCSTRALTITKFVSGGTTHAWAAGLCLFTLLCCIPYCIKGTKNVEHRCSKCGVLLATWHRSGSTEVHLHS